MIFQINGWKEGQKTETYILASSIARPQIEANARTAVGNYAIGNEDVFNIEFPLPPKAEQEYLIRMITENRQKALEIEGRAKSHRKDTDENVEKLILGTLSVEEL